GAITSSAEHVGALADACGGYEHFCANRITRTFGTANEFEPDPVIAVLDHVAQQRRRRINIVKNNIDVTVIEEISESCAASRHHVGQSAAGSGRNLLKSAVLITKKLRSLGPGCSPILLIHSRVNMPIGDKD